MSRKRRAAMRLAAVPTVRPSSEESASVRVEQSVIVSRDSLKDKSEDDDFGKRQRFDSGSTIDSQDTVSLAGDLSTPSSSQCACETSIHNTKNEKLEPLVNDSIYGDFRIVGAGRDTQAVHLYTDEVYTCRVITEAEFLCIQRVVMRLAKASLYYKEHDLKEMIELVFPSKSELIEEVSGRRLLFSPAHFGSLHSFAHHKGHQMSEADVQPLFCQMVHLVSFCHAIGLVVRDLKPRRLAFANKQRTKLRLASVQEVVVCEDANNDVIRDKFGSPAYVPPEVLTSGRTGYEGKPADVWGIGVVLYLLLLGRYPFFDSTPVGVFQKIKKAKISFPSSANLSRAVRALVLGILRRDPSERPTAYELQFMPWTHPTTTPVRCHMEKTRRLIAEASIPLMRRIAESTSRSQSFVMEEWARLRERLENAQVRQAQFLAAISAEMPSTTLLLPTAQSFV